MKVLIQILIIGFFVYILIIGPIIVWILSNERRKEEEREERKER